MKSNIIVVIDVEFPNKSVNLFLINRSDEKSSELQNSESTSYAVISGQRAHAAMLHF